MEIPRHWRLKQQRYSLVGGVCPHCDHKMFPPRRMCPNCGQEAVAHPAQNEGEERGFIVYEYKAEPASVTRG